MILRLEERLLDSAVRRSPEAISALLADEFVEYGSSGRVFDKEQIIESLQGEDPTERLLSDFFRRELWRKVFTVNPLHNSVGCLDDLLPNLGVFEGMAEFTSSQPMIALTVRSDKDRVATFPVTPVD